MNSLSGCLLTERSALRQRCRLEAAERSGINLESGLRVGIIRQTILAAAGRMFQGNGKDVLDERLLLPLKSFLGASGSFGVISSPLPPLFPGCRSLTHSHFRVINRLRGRSGVLLSGMIGKSRSTVLVLVCPPRPHVERRLFIPLATPLLNSDPMERRGTTVVTDDRSRWI